MKNISGNFDTTSQELEIVKEYLKDKKIDYLSVEKYNEADAGDVIVKFKNGYISLFEVKEESIARWEKYHQYGIDFISSFQFKNDVNKSDFQGIKNPKDLPKLLRAIDANFIKWGKIYYSYSDIWLFYVKDKNENIIHLEAYNVNELEKTFFKYLIIVLFFYAAGVGAAVLIVNILLIIRVRTNYQIVILFNQRHFLLNRKFLNYIELKK